MNVACLHEATEEFAAYLSEVTDGDLALPTACGPWTIEDLYHHMVDENIALGRAIDPRTHPPAQSGLRETIYRNSARYIAQALAVADRPPDTDSGVVDRHLANTVIHTWDLANAIRLDFDLPAPYLVEMALVSMRRIPPSERGPGKAYADVPDFPARSTMDELLRLSGRNPPGF